MIKAMTLSATVPLRFATLVRGEGGVPGTMHEGGLDEIEFPRLRPLLRVEDPTVERSR